MVVLFAAALGCGDGDTPVGPAGKASSGGLFDLFKSGERDCRRG